MDVGTGHGSGVRWRCSYRKVDDTITSMVVLHMWSEPGKANSGLEPLLSSMREVPSWGRLDLSQLGASAQFAISRAQLRPRREAFIKSDLAFPQLASRLMLDSKCRLVTASACKHTPAPLREDVFAVLGAVCRWQLLASQ